MVRCSGQTASATGLIEPCRPSATSNHWRRVLNRSISSRQAPRCGKFKENSCAESAPLRRLRLAYEAQVNTPVFLLRGVKIYVSCPTVHPSNAFSFSGVVRSSTSLTFRSHQNPLYFRPRVLRRTSHPRLPIRHSFSVDHRHLAGSLTQQTKPAMA